MSRQALVAWSQRNFDQSRAALRRFEQSPHPQIAASALLDAHRYSYGAWINALDAEAQAMAERAKALHQRVHELLVEVLSAS